ncbi:hypothetical protein [Devosia chinhatensis]|uniref:Uncharacterized protein n=1 Tax=Devosia chinhatensis TaxID=429727 RepID=A0A0F5FMB0_9HYPH|nr:hypothetical protein [Devosia chinhatensis]KKB09958.1 hypothetical protein VE26_09135 [Devosia chinhatensis]
MTQPPKTPDGRYIVVRGRLWRASNPGLSSVERQTQVDRLMAARRRVRSDDGDEKAAARAEVDAAKRALGERGPVWWHDGAPDYNRHMARNTPYAEWFARLPQPDRDD